MDNVGECKNPPTLGPETRGSDEDGAEVQRRDPPAFSDWSCHRSLLAWNSWQRVGSPAAALSRAAFTGLDNQRFS